MSASHSWNGYHWGRISNPLKLTINTKITPEWNVAIGTAVSDWDGSLVLALTARTAPAATDPKRCSPIAGQILVCNAAYGNRGWLGIASIWVTSGHITQGTTKLNDSYFNSPPYNTAAWRALVSCQEIGHDFGLGHQDEDFNNANFDTCMDYTNSPATNQHPNLHDYQMLDTIYAHTTDTANTSTTQATNFGVRQFGKPVPRGPAGEAPSGDSPAEWGRAIHSDGLGRPDVFEKLIAPGQTMVTHVFWAMGEGQRNSHQ